MWEQLPITPPSLSSLALGLFILCWGSPAGNTSQSTFPQQKTQPGDSQFLPVRVPEQNWAADDVMLLCTLHRSQVPSAPSTAAPATSLALVGEEMGENPTLRAARVWPLALNSLGGRGRAPLSAGLGCLLEEGGSGAG